MTDSVESVERLKSIIIEHVAKDVLLLHGEVEKLNDQLKETKDIVKQINSDANGYFDNMAAKVIELIENQEAHLQKIAEQRTAQVEMNISDRVEKILNDKFNAYTEQAEKAHNELVEITDGLNQRLEKANTAAIDNLKAHYMEAKNAIDGMASQETQAKARDINVKVAALHSAAVGLALIFSFSFLVFIYRYFIFK